MSKLKYEDVKKEVQDEGWELLTQQYTNLKTDMHFLCPEKHNNYYSLEKWRKGHKCPLCENNPLKNVPIQPVKKNGYRILAVDQASITSGYAVFDNGDLITYGHWTSNGNHSTEKISQMKAWFACMIEKWKPDIVVLEDIQYQQNIDGEYAQNNILTYKKLAALQGVLKNYCYESGIIYSIVSPSTWRNASQIKGKYRTDKKKNAQLKVKSLYDINVSQDEADSILIGKWAVEEKKKSEIISFE